MKIPVILTCLLAAVLSALPLSKAHADDVSFDVFYNGLADDGDWYNTPEYGYVWQPYIAYKTDKWKPYTDGYWAQTDDGWTWVSYENFGWATYHYGRWTRLQEHGWVWVPGYDWGPGWVSWRTSDDYVGWAPLPPKREQGVYEGRIADDGDHRPPPPPPRSSVTVDYNDVEVEDGYTPAVDEQYDIGPDNYCFVQTHSFGAPVLREVILPPQQNITIIENTVNVTNITYRHDHDRIIVRNGGPDFAFINGRVDRPIQHLRIDRHEDVVFLRDHTRGGGNPTLVRDGVLQVAAPSIARRPVNFTEIKPPRIKQELTAPKVSHGWQNTGADQQTVQRVREQFKQQAHNPSYRSPGAATPPPVEARHPERESGNTPPAPNTTPGATLPGQPGNNGPHRPLTDAEKQARRDAAQHDRDARGNNPPGAQPPPGAPGQPPGAPNAAGKPLTDAEKAARHAQHQGATPAPQGVTPPANPVPSPDADKAARRAQRQQEKQQGATPPANPAGPTDAEKEARRAQRQQEKSQGATPPSQPAGPSDAEKEARRAQRQQEKEKQPQTVPPSQPAGPSDADKAARHAQHQQEKEKQPQAPSQPSGPSDAEKEARRAQRQQEKQPQQAPPQHQAERPQAPPQPQGKPQDQGQGKDDDKKKKKDGQQ